MITQVSLYVVDHQPTNGLWHPAAQKCREPSIIEVMQLHVQIVLWVLAGGLFPASVNFKTQGILVDLIGIPMLLLVIGRPISTTAAAPEGGG
jgi:hypothetical protein